MSTLVAEVRAQNLVVTEDSLIVDLSDGRSITVPIAWYPRLVHGTSEERNNWRWIGDREGIHWPDLDEDISGTEPGAVATGSNAQLKMKEDSLTVGVDCWHPLATARGSVPDYVENLILGQPSGESQDSLRRWLEKRAAGS